MKYEVKPICTGQFGPTALSTNDESEAKQYAQDHASESYYGLAIINTVAETADLGDRTVPLNQAFAVNHESVTYHPGKYAEQLADRERNWALGFVADHADDDTMDDEDLVRAFRALYGRDPDSEDRESGLWSLLCAGLTV